MTLIAQTSYRKIPTLIGDIVCSHPKGSNIPVPTSLGDIEMYLKELSLKPTEYFQKVYVIKPNLAIGMAGWTGEMEDFLKEFRQQCRFHDNMTFETLMGIIDDYDKEKFANSTLIASLFLKTTDGFEEKTVFYPKHAWITGEYGIFDNVIACGSGKEDFCFQTTQMGSFEITGQDDYLSQAIVSNICILAQFLAAEMSTLHSLKSYWGTGFEMIYFNGECFQKLDGLTYVIFSSQFDDDGNIELLHPRLVLHSQYYQDLLLYSSIKIYNFQEEQDTTYLTFSADRQAHLNDLYIVPPLDLKQEVTEIPADLSFEARKVACGFAIITPDNGVFTPAIFPGNDDIVVEYKENAAVRITIRKELIAKVSRDFKHAFLSSIKDT
ncbi:hypothetical protein [Chitinophaga flava]|uniref:Uncharacterized protein n=1 Tax=Chitinophaga flava TaxID=2259036 RepID=A0A365XXP5_9BACT|nr:hypothetical protein [Chitinophaga flava]RBL91122.1 hypothetical protein DF182_00430 [Chitinophaga flava]